MKNLFLFLSLLTFLGCRSNNLNALEGSMSIHYSLHQTSYVNLSVENSYGTTVITLIKNQKISAGSHSASLPNTTLKEGVYFFVLKVKNLSNTSEEKITKHAILINCP